jgi:hypothetical protein
MFNGVVLALMSFRLATVARNTGWIFICPYIILLWAAIIIAWQFEHGWVGLTLEFIREILNCLCGMLVGLYFGAQYAKDE